MIYGTTLKIKRGPLPSPEKELARAAFLLQRADTFKRFKGARGSPFKGTLRRFSRGPPPLRAYHLSPRRWENLPEK